MNTTDGNSPEIEVIEIAPDGDILLDVTFETSSETLKAARRAAKPRPGQKVAAPAPVLKPSLRVGYRVQLSVLKQKSKYFDSLLGDTRFAEAKSIATAFEKLSIRNIKPSEAPSSDLPAVKIHEDDEATKIAGQDAIFSDLLRILHDKPRDSSTGAAKPWTMHQVAALAVLADRFNCTVAVSKSFTTLKFKWPTTSTTLPKEDRPLPSLTKPAEESLRQKILVSWLLDQPPKFSASTRELTLYGSLRWTLAPEDDDQDAPYYTAAWWHLPDDLESELAHRRACILNTLASIPRHFLGLYTSKQRQCKLGYDSSASCDSFQLGEMMKFFLSHNLISLMDFSPSSLEETPLQDHFATVDVHAIVNLLKQVGGYQIDKHHTNCGLRTRITPVMMYVGTMLSSNVVAIQRAAWKKQRDVTSWVSEREGQVEEKVFRFTRSLLGDQRLRYEGAMAADRMARSLFTAGRWDWSPED
ncbi:hypothetical protein QBC34DRAFT_191383 [Podospora aff. communis PSN243]|uniref:Hydroxyproline-rich glyco protein n=1 Tax=Podospora aff. communis PSN243 TaxID=3040156 RepID=A0AAV9H0V4_9PEZI|nr:hypothetical protein QBC34DRAFT_191383 [Podospora aff. communis PSN243]